jgi:hypothetical protein
MEYAQKIIYDALIIFIPNDIIKQIILKYITHQYKYKIDIPELYHKFYYNKQLEIIYCASIYSYKLIDYNTSDSHDSSIINMASFKSRFFNKHHTLNIIYFDNNILLTSCSSEIHKYILNKQKYTRVKNVINAGTYPFVYVYDQCIYIDSKCGTTNCYVLSKYNLADLVEIKKSKQFECERYHESNRTNMTMHNNIIYISEPTSTMTYNILSHNAMTLNKIDNRIFKCEIGHIATIYRDKIHTYGQNEVYVYNITTLNKLYSFEVNTFSKPIMYYNVTVSNDLLIISSDQELMVFDILR